jgi:hypothetical protein
MQSLDHVQYSLIPKLSKSYTAKEEEALLARNSFDLSVDGPALLVDQVYSPVIRLQGLNERREISNLNHNGYY